MSILIFPPIFLLSES